MQGWKGNLLNQEGKETLIKVVIQAIPTYVMSVVQLPKTLCASLSAAVARFWWASHGRYRGIHWKARKVLCTPIDQGGMGFKDFHTLNSSLLAKQAWRLIQQPNSFWGSVLKGLYFPNSNFAEARVRNGVSWVWKSILHLGNGQWVQDITFTFLTTLGWLQVRRFLR